MENGISKYWLKTSVHSLLLMNIWCYIKNKRFIHNASLLIQVVAFISAALVAVCSSLSWHTGDWPGLFLVVLGDVILPIFIGNPIFLQGVNFFSNCPTFIGFPIVDCFLLANHVNVYWITDWQHRNATRQFAEHPTSDYQFVLLHFIAQSACLTPGWMAVTSQSPRLFLLKSGWEAMLPYVRLAGIACWCFDRWSVKSSLSFPSFSGHVLLPEHIGKDEWCGSV